MFVQLEFYSTCMQVMEVLLQFIPPFAHPYDLLGSTSLSSSQTITTLAFHDSQLISGAKDCHVREYNCCSAKYGKHCTKFSISNLWLYNYRFQFGTQLTLLYLKISSYPILISWTENFSLTVMFWGYIIILYVMDTFSTRHERKPRLHNGTVTEDTDKYRL